MMMPGHSYARPMAVLGGLRVSTTPVPSNFADQQTGSDADSCRSASTLSVASARTPHPPASDVSSSGGAAMERTPVFRPIPPPQLLVSTVASAGSVSTHAATVQPLFPTATRAGASMLLPSSHGTTATAIAVTTVAATAAPPHHLFAPIVSTLLTHQQSTLQQQQRAALPPFPLYPPFPDQPTRVANAASLIPLPRQPTIQPIPPLPLQVGGAISAASLPDPPPPPPAPAWWQSISSNQLYGFPLLSAEASARRSQRNTFDSADKDELMDSSVPVAVPSTSSSSAVAVSSSAPVAAASAAASSVLPPLPASSAAVARLYNLLVVHDPPHYSHAQSQASPSKRIGGGTAAAVTDPPFKSYSRTPSGLAAAAAASAHAARTEASSAVNRSSANETGDAGSSGNDLIDSPDIPVPWAPRFRHTMMQVCLENRNERQLWEKLTQSRAAQLNATPKNAVYRDLVNLQVFSLVEMSRFGESASDTLRLIGRSVPREVLTRILAFLERICEDPVSAITVALLFLDRVYDTARSLQRQAAASAPATPSTVGATPTPPPLLSHPARSSSLGSITSVAVAAATAAPILNPATQPSVAAASEAIGLIPSQLPTPVGLNPSQRSSSLVSIPSTSPLTVAVAAANTVPVTATVTTPAASSVVVATPPSAPCRALAVTLYDRLAGLATSNKVHYVLITCVMMAVKVLDDIHPLNKTYAEMLCIPLLELNELELALLAALDFALSFTDFEYSSKLRQVVPILFHSM